MSSKSTTTLRYRRRTKNLIRRRCVFSFQEALMVNGIETQPEVLRGGAPPRCCGKRMIRSTRYMFIEKGGRTGACNHATGETTQIGFCRIVGDPTVDASL
jgi:hypothetical protein